MYAMMKPVAGSGAVRLCTPCMTETAEPTANNPKAAYIDQTYAALP
jgi:hypothetical protein